jgi:hypothetical protein
MSVRADEANAVLEASPRKSSHGAFVDSTTANLERSFGSGGWKTVCTIPCQVAINPELRYRVNGDGIYPTLPFSPPELSNRTYEVRAKLGSSVGWWSGVILNSLGAVGLLAGGAVTITSYASDRAADFRSAGFITMGVSGGAMLLGTILQWVNNSHAETADGKRVGRQAPKAASF